MAQALLFLLIEMKKIKQQLLFSIMIKMIIINLMQEIQNLKKLLSQMENKDQKVTKVKTER